MGKTKSDSWYTYHQGNLEYYKYQAEALAAIDLIVASYDRCIWDDRTAYLSLTCQRGIEVDHELFKKYYSTKILIPDSDGRTFRVDVSVKNKEDWIFKYGSDLLQQSLKSGYDCNEGYLAERLDRDYPDFSINEWSKYKRVDTPNQQCLYACSVYEHSYCSIDKDKYYITIDGYLGKYQLVKLIDPNLVFPRVDTPTATRDGAVEVNDGKRDWIIEHGSDLLQRSFLAGYACNDRYLQERIAYDYPGFEIASRNHPKVDSPDENCFYTCLGYENAYCSYHDRAYYATIDNYLGKYQLIKKIDTLAKISDSHSKLGNFFSTKIGSYLSSIGHKLTNADPFVLISSTTTILVGISTLLYVFSCVVSSIG